MGHRRIDSGGYKVRALDQMGRCTTTDARVGLVFSLPHSRLRPSERAGPMSDSLSMMPWFPRDFHASTRGWSLVQKAVYRELLDVQWDMGQLPSDLGELRELAGATPAQWAHAWPKVSTKFSANSEGLQNARLEAHRQRYIEIRQSRVTAGRKGGHAKAVANASNGSGNAKDLPEQTPDKFLAKVDFCSASIPSYSDPKNQNPGDRASDADAEGAQDPDDFLIWTAGIELLGESKRGLMGSLVKEHGRELVARKISEIMAMTEKPRDAAAYFVGAMRKLRRRVVV